LCLLLMRKPVPARPTFHLNSFLPSTIKLWNELPTDIKIIITVPYSVLNHIYKENLKVPHTIMSVVHSVISSMQDFVLRVGLWKTTQSKGIWSQIIFVLVNRLSHLTTSYLNVLIHTWETIFLLTYLDRKTVIM
jgi:hypothetical protein